MGVQFIKSHQVIVAMWRKLYAKMRNAVECAAHHRRRLAVSVIAFVMKNP
jgi:hypothetical protein